MKKCYIVGAGELFGSFTPVDGDLVIAADGGYDNLLSLGITPSVIIGDLDSVRADLPRGIELIRHKVEKDETDAHLAVTHPGITFTNITAHYPKAIFWVIKHPMKVIFMKPARAALSILSGVFSDTSEGEWIGPMCFDVWGLPKKKALRSCTQEERRRIAEIAETVYSQCCQTVSESCTTDAQ